MAIFNPRRFAQPDKLKEISPGRLLEFFQPFQNYLHGRGLTLTAGRNGIDYPRLAGILMSPDNTTPVDMVDALYFIHEMATQEGMNQLLDAAQNKGLELVYEIESTPADIAVQVWLQDRDLLENQHAQGLVTNPRSFIYFSSLVKKHKFVMPTEETIMALEADLDQWFLKHRRGRGSKVFLFDQDDKISLLIRHGLPTKREGSLKEEGEPTSVHYRPEKHDVVIYNQKLNELAINANTKTGSRYS